MKLRKADSNEFYAVRDFYWNLIDDMEKQQNTVAWKKDVYPTEQFLEESILNGTMYVLYIDEEITACVVLNSLWNEGYDGLPWSIDCPREKVLVPHALGVRADAQNRGVGKCVVEDIIEIARASGRDTIRLDILSGNAAAERLYTKMGFKYVQEKDMFYEDTGWTKFIMYELVL